MTVHFVDLKAQYLAIKPEIDAAIAAVLADAAFVSGKYARDFEADFAAYLGVPHCVGVANGTDALHLALRALGIGPGHEVITAANTFIATSEAITAAGAEPVFVDCDEATFCLDPSLIEGAITPRTRAIIPVHLYGQPADMAPILEIAARRRLQVVEDAAQAHGALYEGRRIGTLGTCAGFSFYPGKNLGAYGDAGAVATGDAEVARRIRMLGDHGSEKKYLHEFEGFNSRLDGVQAAVLQVKLRHLEAWTERRIAVARLYEQGFAGTAVRTPIVTPGRRHVFHLYVVRVRNRQECIDRLRERDIQTGIHYPVPLPLQPAYARQGRSRADHPVSAAMMDEILSLPMHADLSDADVARVVEELAAVAR